MEEKTFYRLFLSLLGKKRERKRNINQIFQHLIKNSRRIRDEILFR